MSDQPDQPGQPGSRDKQETVSSQASAGLQSSAAVPDTTPTVKSSISYPSEPRNPPCEPESPNSHASAKSQLLPANTDITPTVGVEASSGSNPPEPSSPTHENETTVSCAPIKPRLPFTGLKIARAIPEATAFGIQLSTEPAWVPQDSSQVRAPPPPPSPTSASRVVNLPPTPSSPVVVSSSLRLLPPAVPIPTFPILKLPPEIRLMVFDQLFLDLTVHRRRSMMHRNDVLLLRKHQANNFRPYTNLLLTCKELSREAKRHWDKHYLHQCCFYFWHVSKLYDLAMILDKLGGPYTGISYVFRSEYAENRVGEFCLETTVMEAISYENTHLMTCQPGIPDGYHATFAEHLQDRLIPFDATIGKRVQVREGIYEATEENPVRAVVSVSEAGKRFSRAEWSGPESCTISVNSTQTPLEHMGLTGVMHDNYVEMQGQFSGIFWGGYDAAEGYGKFKLWEAMPLCHGPNHHHCQKWDDIKNRANSEEMLLCAKAEREVLLQCWYDALMKDPKWLMLGGEPKDSVLDLVRDYSLEDWLDDESWSELARVHWTDSYLSGEPWAAIRLAE